MDKSINYFLHYKNWHDDTEESLANDMRCLEYMLDTHDAWPKDEDERILDVGCGMGRLLLVLRAKGYENIAGIEIDAHMAKFAKQSRLNVTEGDAVEILRGCKEKYDIIYCFDILEHIEKDRQLEFLSMLRRHLSDNGRLFIQVPNALSPLFAYFRYMDFTHTVSYTTVTLDFIFRNAGFEFFVHRPSHAESRQVVFRKKRHAELFLREFGLENLILTPNIVSQVFINRSDYESYISSVTPIVNDYLGCNSPIGFLKLMKYKILSMICFGAVGKYYRDKYLKNRGIFFD